MGNCLPLRFTRLTSKDSCTVYKLDSKTLAIDTVQDFLIKLGIKPRLHILKISIFSLNQVIVRPTKIMNNLLKDLKILIFEVIFQQGS